MSNKFSRHLDPARFKEKQFLILVGRRTSVVLVSPSPVPDSGNQAREDEDDGSVVDGLGGDGESGGHADNHSFKIEIKIWVP